jgi:hypothetical protein
MQSTTPSVGLRARTLDLVRNAPRAVTYTVMARECGISIAWVSRFAADAIPNPGVDHVQCLHDYLVSLNVGTK